MPVHRGRPGANGLRSTRSGRLSGTGGGSEGWPPVPGRDEDPPEDVAMRRSLPAFSARSAMAGVVDWVEFTGGFPEGRLEDRPFGAHLQFDVNEACSGQFVAHV